MKKIIFILLLLPFFASAQRNAYFKYVDSATILYHAISSKDSNSTKWYIAYRMQDDEALIDYTEINCDSSEVIKELLSQYENNSSKCIELYRENGNLTDEIIQLRKYAKELCDYIYNKNPDLY